MNEELKFRPVRWRMAEGSIMELSKATCPHRKYPLEFYDEGEWLCLCCGMVLVEKIVKVNNESKSADNR